MNNRLGYLVLVGFVALGIAACSSSNSNSLGNPLAGVTVVNYTPTPAPPATPTPTATPTPAPAATQAIADGGFESGGFSAGWTACSIPHVAPSSTASPGAPVPAGEVGADVVSATSPSFYVNPSPAPDQMPEVFAGTYSALTFSGTGAQTTYPGSGVSAGPAGNNGVCQTFTVPENGVLTMEVYEGGSDTGLKYADQEADIVSGSTTTNVFYELNTSNYDSDSTPVDTWVAKGPYNLTAAPYNLTPGSSATLYIGSYDSSPGTKYGVFMFVDNVSVAGTTPGATMVRKRPALMPVRH